MRKKRSYIRSSKYSAPQWYFNKSETFGARPKNKALLNGLIGLKGLHNVLYYNVHNKDVSVNQSKWINGYQDSYRKRKKVTISLVQLRKILREPKSYGSGKNILPIPNTDKMRLQSLCPLLPPIKKSGFQVMDHVFEEFAAKKHGEYDLYNDSNYGAILPNGGWEYAKPHLLRYGESIENEISYESLFQILDKYGSEWEIPVFKEKPRQQDVDQMYVKPESYSGLFTSLFFGATKKQSVHLANQVAKQLFSLTGSKLIVDTSLRTVGGREKLNKFKDVGQETVTRCILQEETPVTQLKQIYSRPITHAYKYISKGWRSSHGIGTSLLGDNWDQFVSKVTISAHRLICGDWSSHDTYVSEKTMVVAFAILRAMWPDQRDVERHFFFFATGHIYKRVIIPGGFVYRIDGGIMSGCPFTSHLNTICCKLEILLCFERIGVKLHNLFTYGDDWIGTISKYAKLPSNVEEVFYRTVGIKMKDLVHGDMHGTATKHTGVSFLQTYSFRGEPGRDFDRVVQKLRYCDKKSRVTIRKRIELACNMLIGNVGNEKATQLLVDYIVFLCNRQKIKPDTIITSALRSSYELRGRRLNEAGVVEQYLEDLSDPTKYFARTQESEATFLLDKQVMKVLYRGMFGTARNLT